MYFARFVCEPADIHNEDQFESREDAVDYLMKMCDSVAEDWRFGDLETTNFFDMFSIELTEV